MKYFLMSEDTTIIQRPFILDWHEKIDVRDIHPESAFKLPKRELVIIRSNSETLFTDIISEPLFLISERVKKVVKMYEPKCMMKELVLLDKVYGKVERYFLPIFEEIDCLGEGTLFNMNRSEIREIVLDERKIGEHSIFRLSGMEKQYIVGNLDIVESILKRGCIGICLTELNYIAAEK